MLSGRQVPCMSALALPGLAVSIGASSGAAAAAELGTASECPAFRLALFFVTDIISSWLFSSQVSQQMFYLGSRQFVYQKRAAVM